MARNIDPDSLRVLVRRVKHGILAACESSGEKCFAYYALADSVDSVDSEDSAVVVVPVLGLGPSEPESADSGSDSDSGTWASQDTAARTAIQLSTAAA